MWEHKKRQYVLLMAKNKKSFSAESFKIYMKAPCGRIMARAVLNDLGIREKYRELLAYREPLLVSIKNNFVPQDAKIYINEEMI